MMLGLRFYGGNGPAVSAPPRAPVELTDIFTRNGQTAALGVWSGTDEADDFQTWLGAAVDLVDKHADRSSWGGMATSISDFGTLNAAADQAIVWSIPPMLSSGTTLSAAASGSYNSNYDTIAAAVLAAHNKPSGPILIRTGWEQNGNWQPWAAQDSTNGDYFKAMWVHFVTRFRAASSRFKFIWCPNEGQSDPDLSWPGAAYVDLIGMDVYYNAGSNAGDGTGYFGFIKTDTYGLDWLVAKGAAESKPICIPEWGVKASQGANVGEPGPATETSSQAAYVALFADWIVDNGVFYATYWDSNLDIDTKLSSGQYPLTGAEFKNWFGAPNITTAATGNLTGDGTTAFSLAITTLSPISSISLSDNADGFGTSGTNLTLSAQTWADGGDNTRTVTVTATDARGLTDTLAYTLTITEPVTDLYPGYVVAISPAESFFKVGEKITDSVATFLGWAEVGYLSDPIASFSGSAYTPVSGEGLKVVLPSSSDWSIYLTVGTPAHVSGVYHTVCFLHDAGSGNANGVEIARDGYDGSSPFNINGSAKQGYSNITSGTFTTIATGATSKFGLTTSSSSIKWFKGGSLLKTFNDNLMADAPMEELYIGCQQNGTAGYAAPISKVLVKQSTDSNATAQAATT